MTQVRWERYPLVAQSAYARSWLSMQGNLGLAQNTVDAYGRALEDYLAFSTRASFSPEEASREHIARYVHDLSSRPNPRGAKIRALDTGYGLANATLQQRLTAVRLFYDYLTEEGRCACWRSVISIRANASSKFVQRRPRAEALAWFPTPSRRGCSTWPISRSDES